MSSIEEIQRRKEALQGEVSSAILSAHLFVPSSAAFGSFFRDTLKIRCKSTKLDNIEDLRALLAYEMTQTKHRSTLMGLCAKEEQYYDHFLHDNVERAWTLANRSFLPGQAAVAVFPHDIGFRLYSSRWSGEQKSVSIMYSDLCALVKFQKDASSRLTSSLVEAFCQNQNRSNNFGVGDDGDDQHAIKFAHCGKANSIQVAETIPQLLGFLTSAKLCNGKLWLDEKDWIILLSSPYLISRIHCQLSSDLRPAIPTPLDQLARGIIGEKKLNEYPSIKTYLQEHPAISVNHRHVNVIVVEKFLSNEKVASFLNNGNNLHFQKTTHNKKYLRVASTLEPPPYITFGNNLNQLTLYEATKIEDGGMEDDVLSMIKWLFKRIDGVINNTVTAIEGYLEQNGTNHGQDVVNGFRFSIDIHEHNPIDSPDTVVSLATSGKVGYGGSHSDSRPKKPCICENNNESHPEYGENFMRIGTIGVSSEDEKVISLQHGIPETGRCKLWGHFCSENNSFICCRPEDQISGIEIGGKSHLHIQLPGSQAELHHWITSHCKRFRCVCSARFCKPFNLKKVELDKVFQSKPSIVKQVAHTVRNVFSMLQDEVVIPSVSPAQENDEAKVSTHRRQRTEMIAAETPRKLPRLVQSTHSNGQLLAAELRYRDCGVGVGASVDFTNYACHKAIVEELFQKKTTAIVKGHIHRGHVSRTRVGPVDIICGPAVVHSGSGGGEGYHRVVRCGEHLSPEQVALLFGIKTTQYKKDVVNFGSTAGVQLTDVSKNTSSVLKNVEAALFGGPLLSMEIRGVGASLSVAGERPISSSSKKARENSWQTHTVSHGQKLQDEYTAAFEQCQDRQQVVNVFFRGIYIGLFYVTCIKKEAASMERAMKEVDETKAAIERLRNRVDELPESVKDVLPTELTTQDNHRFLSMMGHGVWITLVPFKVNLPSEYPWSLPEEECRWNVVVLQKDHFKAPFYVAGRNEMKIKWTIGPKMGIYDLSTLIATVKEEQGKFNLLTTEGKKLLPFQTSDDDSDDGDDDGPETNEHSVGRPGGIISVHNIDTLWNGIFHCSAITAEKVWDSGIIDKRERSVSPPRELLQKVFGPKYATVINNCNYKAFLTRPVHPGCLNALDPAINVALWATQTNKCNLPQRNGGLFVISDETREEAWSIILKCLICTILSTHALLQLTVKGGGKCHIPGPEEISDFLSTIRKYEWNVKVVHTLFRKEFQSADDFSEFISSLSSCGKDSFITSIRSTSSDRQAVLQKIGISIAKITGKNFSPFQMQVIARTIEACINKPFGAIKKPSLGSGSKDGLRCFLPAYRASQKGQIQQTMDKDRDEELQLVLSWVLTSLNEKVRVAKERHDPYIEDELTVLFMDYSDTEKCLVHQQTGRALDENDIEHMMCFYSVAIQATLPNRNVCEKWKLDGEKYHPITFFSDDKIAIDLDVMSEVKSKKNAVRSAYTKLITSLRYKNRTLADAFKIDFGAQEKEGLGGIETES